MTCDSCVQDVTHVLEGAEGIKKFDVNLKEQRVVVEGSGRLPYRGLTFYNEQFSSSAFADVPCLFFHLYLTRSLLHRSMLAPPSAISRLLKNTGKTVIVRGSGVAQGN